MKKQLLTLALLAVAGTAGAQYQLPNGNFEGGAYTSSQKNQTIPNDWNWFDKGSGEVIGTALSMGGMTCSVITESSNSYVKLVANKAGIFPTANGNLTTGTINAGESLGAASDRGLKNYNYSDPTGAGDKAGVTTDRKAQKENRSSGQSFTGKPDALKFRYAAYCKSKTDEIQIRAVVHGAGRYRDPEYAKDNYDEIKWGTATFNATRTLTSKKDAVVLKEAQVEFVAGSKQSSIVPVGVLVSLTTNKNPAAGSSGDFVCFDDIEFVYYHALSSATYDGQAIAGFTENTLNYDLPSQVYDENKFACTVKGVGAEAVKNYDESTGLLTVTVNGNNISADATSKTVYTFQFKKKDYTGMLSALSVNGKAIDTFAEDSYHYTVVGDYTDGCVKATAKGADDVFTTNYDVANRICSINVVGGSEENTYFVKFAKATTDYKGKMSIAMNNGWLSAATSTVGITTPVDGKADFQLLGFELSGMGLIGDIFVTDVPYAEEKGVVNLYKEQTITIFGDMGATLGKLPVVLTGTLKDGKLTANIDITWMTYPITVDLVPLDATSLDLSSNAVKLEGTPLAGMKADMTNKNLTIFLPEATEGVDAKESNVVVGTTASNLSLADGNDWEVTKDFTAAAVSYDRVFKTDNYVQSFVLPFGFTVPEGTTVAELSSVNGDNLVFKPVTATVANKPYLVVTTDKDFINKLTNVQVKATTGADLTTTVAGVSHIGSYTAQNVENVYGYANGKFVKATTGSVKPFRTYVKVTGSQGAAPMAFGVNIEGTVTGINNATTAATAKEAIYNLQGVRVSGDLKHLTKGVAELRAW
jgi:uncharacterized protein YunC (DUF1805 family)